MLICYKIIKLININNKAKTHYMSKHLYLKFVKIIKSQNTKSTKFDQFPQNSPNSTFPY